MSDPYSVLGVSPTATPAEITGAYRQQLRTHHPDMRPGAPDPVAAERLREVVAAYALLRDPNRRADYDRREAARNRVRQAADPVTVTGRDTGGKPPPLWAGPVRWHR